MSSIPTADGFFAASKYEDLDRSLLLMSYRDTSITVASKVKALKT
ncbi:MAG: hypothetical protein QXQ04_09640 [Candidatus Bathyarchaeia archaeon]